MNKDGFEQGKQGAAHSRVLDQEGGAGRDQLGEVMQGGGGCTEA